MIPPRWMLGFLLVALLSVGRARADGIREVTVDPPHVKLVGYGSAHSLLVTGKADEARLVDVTGEAKYQSDKPAIARVSARGVIHAVADGEARITIEAGGNTLTVEVKVEGTQEPRRLHFENDIIPLLSRFGCNLSGCHGKAEGQNGFKLSVFGFDPAADFAALTKEGRGRRVFPAAPEASLLLTKMSGGIAHGGGTRIERGSAEYETIRAWIAAGTPYGEADAPKVASIRVQPAERTLAMKGRQQLRIIAKWSDGRERDVTAHAKFQSNNEALAAVDANGLVTAAEAPGDVAVMASYMGAVDVFRALVPRGERIEAYPAQSEVNFIDGHVFNKLKKLNVLPSELADDTEYLRRVYLDIIGTLPTPAEVRAHLADKRPDRRAKIVDDLLARPEYADYWAMKWADLLRVDRQALGHKRAYGYYQWIRTGLADNKPYDQFVREVVTAEGPLAEVGPAAFYKVVPKPGETASTLSQVFLGVRIACAECHHHPFDRWSQTDYYGMTSFFTPLTIKTTPRGDVLASAGDPLSKHPRTGESIFAYPLGTTMPAKSPDGDRRIVLADWMTAPDNPYLARNLANRMWAHFLGRGLVEPVDDVRATNPPTNPELLDALGKHLIDNKFDVRQLIRAITASRVYQLSSKPNATNERDEQNYSRALFKRIDAEVLLDMVCQTTGVAEKFPGVPEGQRAIQLWDSKVPHYFLKLFGRPVRATACECERTREPSVGQVLHVLNAPGIHDKLNHEGGTVARLVKQEADDGRLIEDLYLTFYGRFPAENEKALLTRYLAKDKTKRREAAEDIAWSMMNSLEFGFNH